MRLHKLHFIIIYGITNRPARTVKAHFLEEIATFCYEKKHFILQS